MAFVPAWTHDALTAAAAGRMAAARVALARVRLRDALALARDLETDASVAGQVAARSYWHGNGFCKIVLAEQGSIRLRLHVWEPGQAAEENIHDHRWDFASVVLRGALVSTTYAEAPAGRRFRAYEYEGGEAGAYALSEAGEVALVEMGVTDLSAGSSYWMHRDVLHQISRTSANGLTATLVVTGPAHRSSTRLITDRGSVPKEHPPAPLTVLELRRVLGAMREVEEAPQHRASLSDLRALARRPGTGVSP